LIKLVLLLFLYSGFCQEKESVNSEFLNKKITKYLVYYNDKGGSEDLISIRSKEFLPFDRAFPGVQGEVFWFKLNLAEIKSFDKELFLLVNTVSVGELDVYEETNLKYKNIYNFSQNGEKNIEVPIRFLGKNKFLFRVVFTKSIYLPISLVDVKGREKFHLENAFSYGVYYTFALIVLLINLFFYIQTKERFFFNYLLLALSIILILFELDGFVFLFFGEAFWIEHIDIVLHTFLLISLILFTTESLQLRVNLPGFKRVGRVVILLNIFPFLIYLFTDVLFWYSLGEVFNAIGLLCCWFVCLLLSRKLIFARFAFVGYSVLYIINVIYVLPSEFGMVDLGFGSGGFKIGSAIEMLVFLYAISYRYKKQVEEKLDFKEKNILQEEQLNQILLSKKGQEIAVFKKYNLTIREAEIVALVLEGNSNKIIAKKLFISESTVKFHVTNVFTKTNVKKRTELIRLTR
jgi:DNA-binding CsgD family transcriptional regulator